jgi:uncharacterized protein YbaP (TraB family)
MPRLLAPLAAALLALLFAGAPARGASPAPAAEPEATPSANTADSRGLLWKIEDAGAQPSYLFGTIHLGDPRVTALREPVRKSFDRAARLTLEMVPDAAALAEFAQAMLFDDATTLERAVGAELYAGVRSAFAARGLPLAGLEKYKPWAVSLILSLPKSNAGLPLDLVLHQRAAAQHKPVDGLETPQEQIAVFDDLSATDQRALLEATLREEPHADERLEALVRAYLARDLGRLRALAAEYDASDPQLHATVMRRLLTERNRRMVERMQTRLRAGNAFIAVGVAHLPGRDGILELLRRQGYRVSAVY